MTDRVYPSTKQNGIAAVTAPTDHPPVQFPCSTKTHLHNPIRPLPYLPTSPASRRRRSYNSRRRRFCFGCLWTTIVLTGILLLGVITVAAFCVLYHPHRPAFSVTSVKISYFNLTTTPSDETTRLTTKMNLTLTAKNPNKKAVFYYNYPMSVTASSGSVILSNGSYATPFTSSPGNIFIIHATMALNFQFLEADSLRILNSHLKRKNGLPMEIVMDTSMRAKLEKLAMKKIRIRVKCDGINGMLPKGKAEAAWANTSKSKCKVDFPIKILKWTF